MQSGGKGPEMKTQPHASGRNRARARPLLRCFDQSAAQLRFLTDGGQRLSHQALDAVALRVGFVDRLRSSASGHKGIDLSFD